MKELNYANNAKSNLLQQIFFHDIYKKVFLFIIFIAFPQITLFELKLILLLPFLLFAYAIGSPYFAIAILATLIGSVIVSTDLFISSALLITLFFLSINLLKLFKIKMTNSLLISSAISQIVFEYLKLYLNQESLSTYMPILLGVNTFYLGYIMLKMAPKFHIKHPRLFDPSFIIFLSITIGAASFAIPTFNQEFTATIMIINFLVLLTNKISGVGVSLTIATILSIFTLSYFDSYQSVLLFLLPSCLICLKSNPPKVLTSVVFLTTYMIIANIYDIDVLINYQILNAFIPVMLFVVLDSRFLNKLARRVPGHYEIFKYQEEEMIKVKEKIALRMDKFSALFSKIGQEFEKSEQGKKMKETIYEIYKNNCINCQKNKECFKSTNPLITLIPKGILKELTIEETRYIESNCIKPAKFLSLIDNYKKEHLNEFKYNQEYIRLKLLITEQLKGVSSMLEKCKEEIIIESKLFTTSIEERVKNLLESHQYDVLYLHIKLDNLNRYSIEASIACIDDNKLFEEIIPLIEKYLNIDFKVVNNYLTGYHGYYRFELASTKNFIIKYGVSQIGKEYDYCGDTYKMINKSDETIIALSDGMGVGQSANQESKFTIEMLEKMIDSGISTQEAIGHVNSLLKMKNRYDTYSTLDILTFNNRTGEAYFTKTGAYASFILRRNRIFKIENDSLPVGIVDKVDPNSKLIRLEDGDLIVMASDGVESGERYDLESTLISIDENDPQLFSSQLLKKCQNNHQNNDDITIIVAKVLSR